MRRRPFHQPAGRGQGVSAQCYPFAGRAGGDRKIERIHDPAVRRFSQSARALQGNIREQAHHDCFHGGSGRKGRNDRIHTGAVRLRRRDQIVVVRSQQYGAGDLLQVGDGFTHADPNILEWRLGCRGRLPRGNETILPSTTSNNTARVAEAPTSIASMDSF